MDNIIAIEPYKQKIAYKEWLPYDRLNTLEQGTIICSHGLGDSAGAFDVMAPVLATKGFRVIAIDLPGHGLSSHTGRYSLHHIAESLLGFVIQLELFETEEDVFLVSHSYSADAAPFLVGTYPKLFKKIVQLDNPGPPKDPLINPFTGESYANHATRLRKFYDKGLVKPTRQPPKYESIEQAAQNRVRSAISFFKISEQAAYNIARRSYKRIDEQHYIPTLDPLFIKDTWPFGAGHICPRKDVEALVENMSAQCLLIKFDSWKEEWWIKMHMPLLKHYPSLKCEYVKGPHHAFAIDESGIICANIIGEFFTRET